MSSHHDRAGMTAPGRLRRGSPGGTATILALGLILAVGLAATVARTTGPTSPLPPATTSAEAPASPRPSCAGTRVPAGDSVQAAINRGPPGATLCLGRGVHRLAEALAPKAGQRLIGEPGAVLSGAVPVSSFRRTGAGWLADGVVPTTPAVNGVCMPGYHGCRYSEAVFLDDRPLWRVTALSELGAGEFYQDYSAGRLYLADDPTDRQVEVARAKAAIDGPAAGVTVRGLVVEKFANDAQRGAITGGSDWTIEGNEVRFNHGVGIQTPTARRVKVVGNHVHHNGQLGIAGWRTADAVYAGNELAFNNIAGFYNADWEAGGGKWTESTRLTVHDNHVHDNRAVGLWFDLGNADVAVEGNRIERNDSDGIRYEISYRAAIRDNAVTGNGFKEPTGGVNGAGIMVSSARDVEISGNLVDTNFNGITLRQDDRGAGLLGAYVLQNTWIHDNRVVMRRGATGLSSSDERSYASRRNRFQDNRYTVVGADATSFAWRGAELTWAQWRQQGHDLGGTYRREGVGRAIASR